VSDSYPAPRVVLPPLTAKTVDEAVPELVAWYSYLFAPDQIVELRALGVQRGTGRSHTEAGFFDGEHRAEMTKIALDITRYARGVYYTLNPLNPDLLARRCNRIDWANEGELASDKDVISRRWLLVDADPIRDRLISATNTEKAHAHDAALAVREYLATQGWPEPILSDSGNGYHLLYRVNLPADDGGLIRRILSSLAARFNNEHVTIDQKVFNAARICKLPGTLARKGDSVPDRPHRRAKLLEVPGS
jgi:hypothetical protein